MKRAVTRLQAAVAELQIAVQRMASYTRPEQAADLCQGLIQIRGVRIDPLQVALASGLRQFTKAGEYKADGPPSPRAFVRERGNLSVGAAAAVPE